MEVEVEADILLEYENEESASAIAHAVSPDNLETPKNLKATTIHKGVNVSAKVAYKGKFLRFISTIDDLLFCVSAAERSVEIIRKNES